MDASSSWPTSSGSSSGPYTSFSNTPDPFSPGFPPQNLPTPAAPSRFSHSPQWPHQPRNTMLFQPTLQSADHDALTSSGNPTYARLLTMFSELSTKHETLREAYLTLATSIPRIFQFIPNSLDIPIPSDSNPLPVPHSRISRSKSDYPLVSYWDRADFSLSDLTTISDDEHSKLGFLEHEDGTLFDQDEARDTRAHARAAFLSLLLKHLAPVTWSQASSLAINWYRAEMLAHCPELGLCSNNWKVDALATEVYSQWSKRRRETIAESVASKTAKRRSDDTNSDPSPQKKRKRDSSSVSTVSKNAKDGKALKKSKNRASTSVILPSVEIPTSVRSPSSPTSPNSTSVPPPARIPSPIPTSSPVQLLLSVNPNSVPPPARIPSPVIQVAPNIETVEKQSALPVAPLNPEIQGRENQSVTKIINPLLGIFGKEPQVANGIIEPNLEHVEGPLASAPSMSGPSISNAIAVAPPQVGNPVPKKAKCHKPGAADTAWNIFGREHMKSYPKHTTAEVKAQYDALDETAKKKYVEAGKLRKGKKLVNKGKEKEANPLESGAE